MDPKQITRCVRGAVVQFQRARDASQWADGFGADVCYVEVTDELAIEFDQG